MATAALMQIQPDLKPVAGITNLTADAVQEASRLMQKNHDGHHVFFNDFGFHDHIAHQMLSMYANGASAAQMKAQFEHNSAYQRPVAAGKKTSSGDDLDVRTRDGFMKGLASHDRYAQYLDLFMAEISSKGVADVLDEYLFGDNDRAKAIFTRLNASVIHPIIHLGLSIEFNLPAMTAEALAWTAVHQDELANFNTAVAERSTSSDLDVSLLNVYEELGQYRDAAKQALPFNVFGYDRYDRMLRIDNGAIADIISKYRVTEDNVEARINEAINIEAYVALTPQLRPYVPKVDFFLMHANNGSVYLPALLKTLGPKKAARLVEHQIRACLIDYMTVGAPAFDPEYIREFARTPSKQPGGTYETWEELFAKANTVNDDGHIVKALRALKGAEAVAGKQQKYVEPLKGDEFFGLARVLLKSTENEPDFVALNGPTNQWVRKAGFTEAWESQKFAKVE